jgi:hypothetical protein
MRLVALRADAADVQQVNQPLRHVWFPSSSPS